jgi:ribosomal protein S20
MEGYLYALRDTPLEELSEAVQYALKTFTRMPYPAELIGRTMALNAQTKEVEKITERLRQKGIIDENGAYIEEAQQGELE